MYMHGITYDCIHIICYICDIVYCNTLNNVYKEYMWHHVYGVHLYIPTEVYNKCMHIHKFMHYLLHSISISSVHKPTETYIYTEIHRDRQRQRVAEISVLIV
jgi:hypothetical protein